MTQACEWEPTPSRRRSFHQRSSPWRRGRSRIPWWVWLVTGAAVALPVLVAAHWDAARPVDRFVQLAWAIPACVLVGAVGWRLERRAYLWLAGRSLPARLKGTFGLIGAALVVGAVLGVGSYALGGHHRWPSRSRR